MKPHIITLLLWTLLWLPSCSLQAQDREVTEKVSREFTLTADAGRSTLALYNIFGSVRVEGTSGNKVVVEVTKTLKGDDATALAEAKKDVQIGFLQRNDSVVVYQQGPFDSRPRRNQHWSSDERHYQFSLDFTVKVPRDMKVTVSTVNGGEVRVENVNGLLQASNVNGGISIKNAREVSKAHTVNGPVEVGLTAAPTAAASYKTINGDITVSYPPTASADLYFKSMHGEMYTDFPQTENLPAQITQNTEREGAGTKYKLRKETAVRLGKGGPNIRLETLNGDVTIKQQTR
ncbi:hypothetical protein FY528_01890 [Hymenobacter lutimineralis]|uniref:DUF4097 domain-containing protein n=1 Tax=Hymenobacter lutimineralis TaxID=2606448 RepID=A0A5D6VEV0_9BACT|nr:hypothetical protein [Hymenobacter lutimineralis]TYZ14503.1 hypothetical protein FY528_01890 [Hymenobacter lutimineralis]